MAGELFYSAGVSDVSGTSDPRKAAELRASDADRERVAAVVREAAAEGRIGLDEVDERLSAVFAAKTYGELAQVTADLPADTGQDPRESAAPARRYEYDGAQESVTAIGILGGFQRRGVWTVPRVLTSVTIMGGGEIDLRAARFTGRDVTIRVVAIMGGVNIIVPEDAEVQVDGVGIMGGFDSRAAGPGKPGAPRIKVTGFAFWGGAGVERRAAGAKGTRKRDIYGFPIRPELPPDDR